MERLANYSEPLLFVRDRKSSPILTIRSSPVGRSLLAASWTRPMVSRASRTLCRRARDRSRSSLQSGSTDGEFKERLVACRGYYRDLVYISDKAGCRRLPPRSGTQVNGLVDAFSPRHKTYHLLRKTYLAQGGRHCTGEPLSQRSRILTLSRR